MLTGREQETAFLENHYKRPGSQILVVYGQRGVGKTALLTAFTEEKQTIRYNAPNCSSRELCYQWGQFPGRTGERDFTEPFLGRSITVCIRRKK